MGEKRTKKRTMKRRTMKKRTMKKRTMKIRTMKRNKKIHRGGRPGMGSFTDIWKRSNNWLKIKGKDWVVSKMESIISENDRENREKETRKRDILSRLLNKYPSIPDSYEYFHPDIKNHVEKMDTRNKYILMTIVYNKNYINNGYGLSDIFESFESSQDIIDRFWYEDIKKNIRFVGDKLIPKIYEKYKELDDRKKLNDISSNKTSIIHAIVDIYRDITER